VFLSEELFGIAEFQPGQEEPAEVPIADATPAETSTPAATTPFVVPVVGGEKTDFEAVEGFSMLQKGLFLAVILGCVAAYLRMNGRKQRRYQEKDLA